MPARRTKNQKALMLFLLCGVMLLILGSGLGVVMKLAAVPQDVRGQASTISDLNLIADTTVTESESQPTAETALVEGEIASDSSESTKSGQTKLSDIRKNQPIGVTFIMVLLGLGILIGGVAIVAIHFISKFGAA